MHTYTPEGTLYNTEKNRELTSSIDAILRAKEAGTILEGRVALCDHAMSLHVPLGGGIEGIIPKEEVSYSPSGEPVKDIAVLTRVGKTVSFKVKELSVKGGRVFAILSRRLAQKECFDAYIRLLRPGDVIRARITHLEGFGAFLDIGCGIASLLSIDQISVSRISHPSARLRVGEMIYAVVRALDEHGRILLSVRELLGSWEENALGFSEGQTVRGIIRSVESYGVFVELKPNLAGLAEPKDDALPGQSAAVYIKSIIPQKMKIKLIIIDTYPLDGDPAPIEYFIDTQSVRHIDSWQYSPPSCKRLIETVF